MYVVQSPLTLFIVHCSFLYLLILFIIFLDILSGRSLEHGVLTRRRTQDNSRQALGHNSTFEEGMESLIRLQSERVLRSGPSPASYHRRKGGRKRSQVRRSDSCHLDPLNQRIPDLFSRGRKIQLLEVLQGSSSCGRMDQHPSRSRAPRITDDLLHLHWREDCILHQKLQAVGICGCPSILIQQMVFSCQRANKKPCHREQE